MARLSLLCSVGIAALFTSLAACGGGEKDSNTPDNSTTSTASTTSTGTTTGTTTSTAPSATASTPPAPKGPGKTGAFVEGNKKSAKGGKIAAFIKPEDEAAVRAKLDAAVEKEGEGMQFEGSPSAARFKQGEVLELTVTAVPGKCYTVVAVSADGGITELDGQVVVSLPTPVPVAIPPLATDASTGPNVTMGGGGACIKSTAPAPAPATVQIKATKGAGVAAVQVLSK
jgi:hypothetical protein